MEAARDRIGVEGMEEALRSKRQDRRERERYAARIYVLAAVWLVSILMIIVAAGSQWGVGSPPSPGEAAKEFVGLRFQPRTGELFLALSCLSGFVAFLDWAFRVWDRASIPEGTTTREGNGDLIGPSGRRGARTGLVAFGLAWLFVTVLEPPYGVSITGFTLDPSVLIALVTTTTVNVLGLFYIVARYLFPSENGKTAKPEDEV